MSFLLVPKTSVNNDLSAAEYTKTDRVVTAALRVTLRDMTETYVSVAWDRAVPDDHAS